MAINDIDAAVQFAVDFCNDEDHGYKVGGVVTSSQPDTDCSGLVYYSLKAGGFSVPGSRWDTSNMDSELRTLGFTEYVYPKGSYSNYTPQYGDICMYRVTYYTDPRLHHGHAFFYAENVLGFESRSTSSRSTIAKARVEAVHDYNGQPGDSQYNGTGAYNEVWVHPYNGLYDGEDKEDPTKMENREWHVFRWGGTPPGPSGLSTEQIIAMLAMAGAIDKKKNKRVKIIYPSR